MTFSAIPYALQNASHSAALFRQATSALLPYGGGVVDNGDMAVTPTGTASMNVVIGVGRGLIQGTQVSRVTGGNFSPQGIYYVENDAPMTVGIAPANGSLPRIDLVYVAVKDSQYGGSVNGTDPANVVTGTPISGAHYPTNAPAIPVNALVLGWVYVAAGGTSISSGAIGVPSTLNVLTPAAQPFAMACGTVTVNVVHGSNFGSAGFTFPSGLFTQPPIVTISFNSGPSGAQPFIAKAFSVTASGAQCGLYDGYWAGGAANAFTAIMGWTAVQMTPGHAAS